MTPRRTLAFAALPILTLLASCSSNAGKSDATGGTSGRSAAKSYVIAANRTCANGKVAMSKVPLTVDVVPKTRE